MMSGPPTLSVALCENVVPTGSPEIVAPLGFDDPILSPLGPVPTAGPGPGRKPNSLSAGWRTANIAPVAGVAGVPLTTKLNVSTVALVTVKTPVY